MFPLFRTLSVRYLTRRWMRAVLIVVSIALGVATLVVTQALNDTMARASLESGNPIAGIVDLMIVNGELPIARSLADEVQKVSGVRDIHPRLYDFANLNPGKDTRRVMVMGVDVQRMVADSARHQDKVELSPDVEMQAALALLQGKTPTVLGAELDKNLDFKQLDLEVERNGKVHTLRRVGWINARDDMAVLAGQVLLLDLDSAAKVLGYKPGQVLRLDVVLEPAAKVEEVRAAIRQVLQGRAEVRTPAEQDETVRNAMGGLKAGFALSGLAALVVGMFLVYNALSVTVAERRHEIGILLSLGAGRGQILGLFTGEAMLLGLAGALVGIPVGIALAWLSLQPMQKVVSDVLMPLNSQQVELNATVILLALAAGIVSSLIASLIPAFQAARERPVEAVRRMPKPPTVSHLLLQILVSMLFVLVGMLVIALREYLPARTGTFGGMALMLVGVLLATPILASLAARFALQPLARRWFSIAWRLAADNLVRSPGRTGMVIGALSAGVALVVQTAGVIRSNRQAIRDWVDASMAADIIVSSGSPIGSGGISSSMTEDVGIALRSLPEVEAALPVRFVKASFQGTQIALLTVDAGKVYQIEKTRDKQHAEVELYRMLDEEPDTCAVSENFAILYGIRVHDRIRVPGTHGEVSLKVIGTIVDFSSSQGVVIMHRRDYLRHWDDRKVDVFDVYLHQRPDIDPAAVKEKLNRQYQAQFNLYTQTRAELQDHIDGVIERFYSIAYAQQMVVMLVAALGVVMALLISVLQRRREMGLLRAIGASQGQVIQTVLAEACLMGLLGTTLGVLFGLPMQWYVLYVVIVEEAGFRFPMYIPWLASGVIAAVAMLTATLAGLGPALYSVRQRIPEAIAYE